MSFEAAIRHSISAPIFRPSEAGRLRRRTLMLDFAVAGVDAASAGHRQLDTRFRAVDVVG